MDNQKILIIDDDDRLRSMLAMDLSFNHYYPFEAINGKDGLNKLRSIKPDILLLDLGLPDIDGKELIFDIRKIDAKLMIIVITARTSEKEQIELLNLSADDYLVKPFTTDLLHAKIQKILSFKKEIKHERIFQSGDIYINFDTQTVKINNKLVELTILEYKIVELLTKNAGKIIAYDYIGKYIWNDIHYCNIDTLRVEIQRIRQKFEKDPQKPELFICHFKKGYSFTPPQK